jgi:TetR/AcrR family transcriptional regulator, transcriptional repressor for nem operon
LRLTREQSEKNQHAILEAASRLFRLHGLENVSVADVMHECGFTIGGFYKRFTSKEDLAIEAVRSAFTAFAGFISDKIAEYGGRRKGLDKAVADYLSEMHRDSEHGGCPASALPCDSARSSKDLQKAYAEGVENYLEIFSAEIGGPKQKARQEAMAILSGMVGAVALARAVKKSNPKLSQEILNSARKYLTLPAS